MLTCQDTVVGGAPALMVTDPTGLGSGLAAGRPHLRRGDGCAVLLIAQAVAGYEAPRPLEAIALMVLGALLLMTLGLFGSTLLSTIANGVVIFSLFGLAWLAGLIEVIGVALPNQAMVKVGSLGGRVRGRVPGRGGVQLRAAGPVARASTTIPATSPSRSPSARRKLVCSAMKPIVGGPTRNPA